MKIYETDGVICAKGNDVEIPTKVVDVDDVVNEVETMLSKQPFYDWYNTDYEKFISGDEDAKSKEEILEDIKKLLNL